MTTAQRKMLRDIGHGELRAVPTGGTPGRCWRSMEGRFVATRGGVPVLLPAGQRFLARLTSGVGERRRVRP